MARKLRARDGEEMIGLGPMVFTNEGPVFIEQLIEARDADPTSSRVKEHELPADDLSKQNTRELAEAKTGEADDDESGEEAATKAIDDELRAFRRYCTNRLRVGKSLDATKFESDVLPLDVRQQIVERIVTSRDVGATFDAVEKAATGAQLKLRAQRRYRRVLKSYFADLASAMSAHLKSSLEAKG